MSEPGSGANGLGIQECSVLSSYPNRGKSVKGLIMIGHTNNQTNKKTQIIISKLKSLLSIH